jgi:hypothetical protein
MVLAVYYFFCCLFTMLTVMNKLRHANLVFVFVKSLAIKWLFNFLNNFVSKRIQF